MQDLVIRRIGDLDTEFRELRALLTQKAFREFINAPRARMWFLIKRKKRKNFKREKENVESTLS